MMRPRRRRPGGALPAPGDLQPMPLARRRTTLIATVACAGAALVVHADEPAGIALGPDSRIVFATAAEGRAVLEVEDAFLSNLSPFDRAIRLKSAAPVSPEDFRRVVGDGSADWTAEERDGLVRALATVAPAVARLALPFPAKVLLAKTAGGTEGDAAFTRGDAVFLPARMVRRSGAALERLLAHELFHVLSRHAPGLRERLYAAIGFVHVGVPRLPAGLESRRITNPDAPSTAHAIRVTHAGVERWGVPLLFAESAAVDPAGPGLFGTMRSKLLLVERLGDGAPRPVGDGEAVTLVDFEAAGGFFEQVGRNTGYLIHPEEILADNFVLVVLGGEIRSPAITDRIRRLLGP